PACGGLRDVAARTGDVIPVGRTIATIFAAGEAGAGAAAPAVVPAASAAAAGAVPTPPVALNAAAGTSVGTVKASPLARKIAEQHGVDLGRVTTASGRIEKADVLAYVESQKASSAGNGRAGRVVGASPKEGRISDERGMGIHAVHGSSRGCLLTARKVAARR